MSPPNLVEKVYAEKAKAIKLYPTHTNRASSLGGECIRELVYQRTHWEKAALHDVGLQLVFEEGNLQEKQMLKDLAEAGVQVHENQVSLEIKDLKITAHPDGIVVTSDGNYPMDAKSMNPHIWSSIFFRGAGVYEWAEVAEGFQKKPWLRRYKAQIMIYCYIKNLEMGILLFKDKSNGSLAQINIPLDYGYVEELLQRAARINAHVQAGTLPERIPYDPEACPRCRFYGECLPEQAGGHPLAFVTDSRLESILEERARYEDLGREFARLDKEAKEIIRAKPWSKAAIGGFLIQKTGNEARTTIKIEKIGQ